MTTEEFNQTCHDVCHHCAAGIAVRQRIDNKEWVHDSAMTASRGVIQGHTICLATNYRNKFKDQVVG